jgi:hypothetical protein
MTTAKPTKSPRKKRAIQQAFVVTVVAAGAAASGCGEVTTITNPPSVDCPATVPTSGDACDADLLDVGCSYDDPCTGTVTATCTAGGWTLEYEGTCNPPPPEECPVTRPAVGEACGSALVPPSCDYPIDTACGPATVTLVCELDPITTTEIWQVTASPTCDQPIDCSTLDPTVCGAHTQCRYLVPGCGDGPPPAGFENGGCFAVMDCGAAECGADQTCTVVTYNPCYQSECAACGADASVCLPTPGGA